jgi:hypothetical protein
VTARHDDADAFQRESADTLQDKPRREFLVVVCALRDFLYGAFNHDAPGNVSGFFHAG